MDRAADLVRAPGAGIHGREANAGAGMKIGIVDTGSIRTIRLPRRLASALDGFPKGARKIFLYQPQVIVARSYVALLNVPFDPSPKDHSDMDGGRHDRRRCSQCRARWKHHGCGAEAYLGNYKIFGSPEANDTTPPRY